jgi:hypothetical protein
MMSLRRIVVSSLIVLSLTLGLRAISLAQIQVRPRPRPRPLHQNAQGAPVVPSPGNWSQLGKFVSGQGTFGEYFGSAIGVSGDTVVVGGDPTYSNTRAAYVYLKTAQGWVDTLPVAALVLPAQVNTFFAPLAIDGDTVVVGIPSNDSGYPSYAYMYVKPPGGWKDMKPTATLTPSDSLDGYFGMSVSISGNTIVVGDSGYESTVGAGYVYVKPSDGWADMTETGKLTASDGLLNDELGISASISGSTIALGAPQRYGGTGKAYIFVEPAAGWTNMTQTAELTVAGAQGSAEIGSSIAVSGNTALVGATTIFGDGSAYIFEKPASGWANTTETATLLPGDGAQTSYFATAIGLSGKIAIVGALRRSIGVMAAEGGIYVFEEPNGGWKNLSSVTVLTGSDARYYSFFGESVAIDGKEIVGGAPIFLRAGEAFIFGLP